MRSQSNTRPSVDNRLAAHHDLPIAAALFSPFPFSRRPSKLTNEDATPQLRRYFDLNDYCRDWFQASILKRLERAEADVTVFLHHVNIRARNLDQTIAFYVDALGLTEGFRPPFGFPGAWLYDGAKPAVHLVLASSDPELPDATLDHVAFAYDALDPILTRLGELGLSHTAPKRVPGTDIRQCFLRDPNGVTVELQGP